jgi:carbon-monoxide dehydrogenase medium subunit
MKYVRTKTADEALQSLLRENGNAQIIAGGSDLMVKIQDRKAAPEVLVDVTFAADMKGISIDGNEMVIGAAATFTEIAGSPVVKKHFPSLCKGAGAVGSLQIRNSATLAGNVMIAQPAADAAMALAPLAPKFVILSGSGAKMLSMDDIYAVSGKSNIDPTKEVVKEIRIPLPAQGDAASFIRIEQRKSLAFPIMNVAAMLNYTGGQVQWARITMGPAGIGPVRAKEAENFLAGKALNKENVTKAGELALKDAKFGLPNGEYCGQALPVLVRRALDDIAAQLGAM